MRCVILFDKWGEALDNIAVISRDEVREVILNILDINHDDGTAIYSGDVDRNHDIIVDSAVFIDTEAGTSEEFKISARITAEIIIT
jgi:hypothetical protein